MISYYENIFYFQFNKDARLPIYLSVVHIIYSWSSFLKAVIKNLNCTLSENALPILALSFPKLLRSSIIFRPTSYQVSDHFSHSTCQSKVTLLTGIPANILLRLRIRFLFSLSTAQQKFISASLLQIRLFYCQYQLLLL